MVHGCSAMISRFQICDLPDGCEGMLNYLVVKWLRRHGAEDLLSEFHQNMIESQLLKHKLVGFRQGMQIHCLPVVSTSCISCITCGLFFAVPFVAVKVLSSKVDTRQLQLQRTMPVTRTAQGPRFFTSQHIALNRKTKATSWFQLDLDKL